SLLFLEMLQQCILCKSWRRNNVGGPRRTCCHYKKRSIKEKGSPNLLDLKFHPKTRSST
ncbi:hypothetical protein HN51_025961, partial [Arachis hypogaea]